jgi:hypothetical protein
MQVLEKEHQEVQALKSTADVLVGMDYKVRKA